MRTKQLFSAKQEKITRSVDIGIATLALLLLLPLIGLICVAIMVESGRPIFFRQIRLGQRGRHFEILKFRKFHQKSGPCGLPLTLANDSRMTLVGRVLARTKLDELPQCYNVLRGEMSLVGPRPESLDFADCFTPAAVPVLDYRPGLFGPSQIAFRNESFLYPTDVDPTIFYRKCLFPAKTRLDLAYYPNRTPASDLGYLIAGALAVIGFNVHSLQSGRGSLIALVPTNQSSRDIAPWASNLEDATHE